MYRGMQGTETAVRSISTHGAAALSQSTGNLILLPSSLLQAFPGVSLQGRRLYLPRRELAEKIVKLRCCFKKQGMLSVL